MILGGTVDFGAETPDTDSAEVPAGAGTDLDTVGYALDNVQDYRVEFTDTTVEC